jgi:hypothetical protein
MDHPSHVVFNHFVHTDDECDILIDLVYNKAKQDRELKNLRQIPSLISIKLQSRDADQEVHLSPEAHYGLHLQSLVDIAGNTLSMIILREILSDQDLDGEVVVGIEWEKNKKRFQRWGRFRQSAANASPRTALDEIPLRRSIFCS